MPSPSYLKKHKVNQKKECSGPSCMKRLMSTGSGPGKRKSKHKPNIPSGKTKPVAQTPDAPVRFDYKEDAVAGGGDNTEGKSKRVVRDTPSKVNRDPALISKFNLKPAAKRKKEY